MADTNGPPTSVPECWTRVELSEHRFVEVAAEHTDGVVIPARFDAAPSAGGPQNGAAGSLKNAALASRLPYLIDLETWRLPYIEDLADETFKRDLRTLTAQALPLPMKPQHLADDTALQPLVRAAITAQVGAHITFAPDFQIASLTDPALEVNLRALAMTGGLVPGGAVGAWIHVTLETMLSGLLPHLAARYASLLAPGATVVLTVSSMQPGLSSEEFATYFLALMAFESVGLHVVVDRAGEASIAAVASFAQGCILGNRIYRTAPPSPHFTSEFNPRVRLRYYVGSQGRRVPREKARERHARGRLPDCAHKGCDAVRFPGKNGNLRARQHSAHELRNTIRRARRIGLSGQLAEWDTAKLKELRLWAQGIVLASALREEA
jgi:hypothetical protein